MVMELHYVGVPAEQKHAVRPHALLTTVCFSTEVIHSKWEHPISF